MTEIRNRPRVDVDGELHWSAPAPTWRRYTKAIDGLRTALAALEEEAR